MLLSKQVLLCLQIFFVCIIQITCDSDRSIIIIGAGASGISAATKLLKNNITNFKILEAEDRIGGRIHSVKFGDATIDLGAEFCHGETNNIVYDLVKDFNILRKSKEELEFRLNTRGISDRESDGLQELAYTLTGDNNSTVCESLKSVGDCLDVEFEKFRNSTSPYFYDSVVTTAKEDNLILNRTKIWLHNAVASYEGALDLHDLSTHSHFEVSGGDLHLNWNGLGYKTFLDILMEKYPATATPLAIDDKILLNKEVSKISKWDEGEQVEVTCKDGSTYKAEIVIFSPSLGVLKADHHKLFEPSLPQEKIDAIENIGFGAIAKIFMEFSKNTTLDHMMATLFYSDQFQWKSSKGLDWLEALTVLTPAPSNPRVILGWYGGKDVPRIEELSDDEVLRGQNHLSSQFLSYEFNSYDDILPTKVIRSKWLTNPHFRGTYSYESVKSAEKGNNLFEAMSKPLLNKAKKPTVLFMGEATNPKHYSTVHGAVETGYREAQRIIDELRSIS